MKKAVFTLILVLGVVAFAKGQSSINDYKYVIVQNKYDFLKSDNQYQLNSLTNFLFKKYGFSVLMEGKPYPVELKNNLCLALNADVLDQSGMFKTKLIVELKNCKNEIIYTSESGESKEKDFKKAYHLALRDAFKSFETNKYSYKPNENIIAEGNKTSNATTQEIKELKEEIKTLKEDKSTKPVVIVKAKEENKIVEKEITKVDVKLEQEQKTKPAIILYAQIIDNGFQVIDSTPKVVMILLTTPKLNTFIVKGRDAIVYKEDGFWFISENKGKLTTTEKLEIKF